MIKSVDEDKRDSLAKEYDVRSDSAETWEESMAYRMEKKELSKQKAETVEDGAEPYIPVIEAFKPGEWKVVISLKGDRLDISVNGHDALQNCQVNTLSPGSVHLESAVLPEESYRQRNITDDVFEGRYKDLKISSLEDNQDELVLYDDCLHGADKASNGIITLWNRVINWFVVNL